jgi:hypothetical protein
MLKRSIRTLATAALLAMPFALPQQASAQVFVQPGFGPGVVVTQPVPVWGSPVMVAQPAWGAPVWGSPGVVVGRPGWGGGGLVVGRPGFNRGVGFYRGSRGFYGRVGRVGFGGRRW